MKATKGGLSAQVHLSGVDLDKTVFYLVGLIKAGHIVSKDCRYIPTPWLSVGARI
jgi:hypothetical protein